MRARKGVELLILISFGLCSCLSLPKEKAAKPFEWARVAALPIGATMDEVRQIVGEPAEVREGASRRNEVVWYYDEASGGSPFQRGAVSFDSATGRVTSKTWNPMDRDPESRFDHLLKQGFLSDKLETVPYPRCGQHYTPSQVLKADPGKGIAVVVRSDSDWVESIFWEDPAGIRKAMEEVRTCVRRL